MIIGIAGKKQVGKSTAAGYLAELFLGQTQELSFAAKLKESFAALFGIPVEWLELLKTTDSYIVINPSRDLPEEMKVALLEIQLSFRGGLQRYGTEAHRDIFGEPFWIEQAFAARDISRHAVIPDVRFPNELEAVKDRGGYLIKIKRPSLVDDSDDHQSEQDLPDDQFDWIIENEGTLDDLRHQVFGHIYREYRTVPV